MKPNLDFIKEYFWCSTWTELFCTLAVSLLLLFCGWALVGTLFILFE